MAVTVAAHIALGHLPTPLVRAHRLERALGLPPLYVKRDDLIGFSLAGNKTRLLERLVADALVHDCGVLVTGGGPASSYCQGAAVAAAMAGMRCVLVMYGDGSAAPHPNLALAQMAGAEVRFTGAPARESVDAGLEVVAAELRAGGEHPYVVPRGGATAIAATGFAHGAAELDAQLTQSGVRAAMVVLATGSGATQAGLLAGAAAIGPAWRVVGASVSRAADEAAAQVRRLASECAEVLGSARPDASLVDVRDARGPGYGVPSEGGERVARVALREEGLVLDPVFTAKALACLCELGLTPESDPVVFWHTGGIPVALAHAAGRESRT